MISVEAKVIIGILQVDIEPWVSIYKSGQLTTWMEKCPKEVRIVNLFGEKPSYFINKLDRIHESLRLSPIGNGLTNRLDTLISELFRRKPIPKWQIEITGNHLRINSKTKSTYLTQVIREFSLFEFFLNCTNADYLYMTNTSSYVNFTQFMKEVSVLPKSNLYGGTDVPFENFHFYSGANRIFSRDVVSLLFENFSKIDYRLLNDVAIGKLLKDFHLNRIEMSSLTFDNEVEISRHSREVLLSTSHFRLKSGELNSRNDVQLMHVLDKTIGE
jgi:hypothetical protein